MLSVQVEERGDQVFYTFTSQWYGSITSNDFTILQRLVYDVWGLYLHGGH